MKRPWPLLFLGVIAVASAIVLGTAAARLPAMEPDAEPVAIELTSGRHVRGMIDPASDGQCLWLQWQQGGISIRRSIAWNRIEGASVAGRPIDRAELRRQAIEVEGPTPPPRGMPRGSGRIVWEGSPGPSVPADAGDAAAPFPVARPLEVDSLEVDARAANWDGDVEQDGLVVTIRPRTADGDGVQMHGTLQVELLGTRGGRYPVRLGRWSQRVLPEHFVGGVAQYRLPYRAVHPEFDLATSSHGTVHVRLSVPGRGVFERTAADVRLRPYSAARDRLQQATGRRFLATERTGRGH